MPNHPMPFCWRDRFPLQPRDVVFVDRAEGIRWNQIIEQIQPTVALLNQFIGIPFPSATRSVNIEP